MQTAKVSASIGGTVYTGFEYAYVMGSVKEAARDFHLKLAEEFGGAQAAAAFQLFAPVKIFEGQDVIFTGYIDKRRPAFQKGSARIDISGRAKGQDAVDCSCIHATGTFTNQTPLQIAQALDKFGIGFSSDTQLDPVPQYQVQPGASLCREIERLCRDQQVTLSGQADGSIKITKAGANPPRQATPLREGQNIKLGSADFDGSNRFSIIYVRGQSSSGSGPDNLQIEATATDSTVPRYRPLVFLPDGDTDQGRAATRAVNRRDKAAGEGIRAKITTPGWRDDTGVLWTPGNKVWVESQFLGLAQDMLIECVEYEQDEDGSLSHLSLVDPRAHGGQAGKGSQSGGEWNLDSSAAQDS